jgi:hypothetical protein
MIRAQKEKTKKDASREGDLTLIAMDGMGDKK